MSEYIGNELELFEHAENWKKYYSNILKKYIIGRVVEVGAGLGGTTLFLFNKKVKNWVCLEPDPLLFKILNNKLNFNILNNEINTLNGNISLIKEKKDTIIYIDVLEHIENDKNELENAYNLLADKGVILIVVPAFNFLYNNFDKAIGHYRRYTKKSILKIIPENIKIIQINYLDSLGFFSSLLNKYILKQEYPNLKQVLFWDKILIPFSKFLDILFNFSFGKSLIIVLQK